MSNRNNGDKTEAGKAEKKVSDIRFPPDPGYGSGVYRRRIRLTRNEQFVLAEMEDDPHAMMCKIAHDGDTVTAVEADFRHYPLTTCPGAIAPLRELVGLPVNISTADFFAGGRARANCTHMLDLAWLALRHVGRDQVERHYAIDIPDEQGGIIHAVLLQDGQPRLEWRLDKGVVTTPGPFEGRNPLNGFNRWAIGTLQEDDLETALVLQKGLFVSGARRFDPGPGPLDQAEQTGLAGICFGYGAERIATARRCEKGRRDFTAHPERLLKFL